MGQVKEDRGAYLGALLATRWSIAEGRGVNMSVYLVARHATTLRRYSRSLQSLAIADCNVGLTDRQETRRDNLQRSVAELAALYDLRAETSGDPRGAVVKLFDPADETKGDGFGGGWPVY
jgi:hypothetical protein